MAHQVKLPDQRIGNTCSLSLAPFYAAGGLRDTERTVSMGTAVVLDPDHHLEGEVLSWVTGPPCGFEVEAPPPFGKHPLGDLEPVMAPCFLYDSEGTRYETELDGADPDNNVYYTQPLPPEVDTDDLVYYRIPSRPLAVLSLVTPTELPLDLLTNGYAGPRVVLWRFTFAEGDNFEAVGEFRALGRTTTEAFDVVLAPRSPGEVTTEVLEVLYKDGPNKGQPVDVTAASYCIGHAGRELERTVGFGSICSDGPGGVQWHCSDSTVAIPASLPNLTEFPVILVNDQGHEVETYVKVDTPSGDVRAIEFAAGIPTTWFGTATGLRFPLLPTLALTVAEVNAGQVTMSIPETAVQTPGAHVCLVRLTVDSAYHWLSCPFNVRGGRTR